MKILEYFEKAWIMAMVAAFGVATYNLITLQVFDRHVYFPIICGVFCVLIWYNLRGQRKFREKMLQDEQHKTDKPS
ncbi:MAG: hypothetical protein JNK66_12285 [Chitinophagales bacterium]|nr:hypothetical protein [Chitinophagales bacterium]